MLSEKVGDSLIYVREICSKGEEGTMQPVANSDDTHRQEWVDGNMGHERRRDVTAMAGKGVGVRPIHMICIYFHIESNNNSPK